MGSKDLGTPTHLISSPRPTPRSKKCPRTNEENPDLQIVLLRKTVSSTGQIMGEKNATSPEVVHSRIAREIPGLMG